MNNLRYKLPFKYDHAVAIIAYLNFHLIFKYLNLINFLLRKDIWGINANHNTQLRSSCIGYSNVGGICTDKSYSIIEDMAFNSIGVRIYFIYFKVLIKLIN